MTSTLITPSPAYTAARAWTDLAAPGLMPTNLARGIAADLRDPASRDRLLLADDDAEMVVDVLDRALAAMTSRAYDEVVSRGNISRTLTCARFFASWAPSFVAPRLDLSHPLSRLVGDFLDRGFDGGLARDYLRATFAAEVEPASRFTPGPALPHGTAYAVMSTTTCARWDTEEIRHDSAADAWAGAALDLCETDAGFDPEDVNDDAADLLRLTVPGTWTGRCPGVEFTVGAAFDDDLVTVEPRDAADLDTVPACPVCARTARP